MINNYRTTEVSIELSTVLAHIWEQLDDASNSISDYDNASVCAMRAAFRSVAEALEIYYRLIDFRLEHPRQAPVSPDTINYLSGLSACILQEVPHD